MRLKPWEIDGIVEAIECVLKKEGISLRDIELRLYGSRADDQKKGGDIDLLLRIPSKILAKIEDLRFRINIEMQKRIGEQKIDLLVIDQNPPEKPFHRIALRESLLLKKW
jgi:predicted nucleotidyltransferase